MSQTSISELQKFLGDWNTDQNAVKPLFEAMCSTLAAMPDVVLEYKGRPGISHSLRAQHTSQKNRPLFVLVDVIDDEPDARWLSVCFYADYVSDPEEQGDVVPGGLFGEDACCFDIEEADSTMQKYMEERLCEAAQKAQDKLA